MKVCILSMQRVLNYGSLLQAYSLMKLIKSLGHEVSFIDIEPNEDDNAKRLEAVSFEKEYINSNTKILRKNLIYRIMQQDSNPLYALKKINSKKQVSKKQNKFGEEYLLLNSANNTLLYDTCVIGSDEVFNCLNDSEWGFTSQLFGNIKQANKVITYAASCGFTIAENVPYEVGEIIKTSFQNINKFSVRDNNTKKFVTEYSDKEVDMHLDPVIIGDFYEEMQNNNEIVESLPKRYCIIYAYHARIHATEEIEAILNFCKKENLELVSIGGYQKWVHKHLELNPFEVLVAFQNANFVITDTFHGAIFSAKYAKHFAVIVRESNANKLNDLISRLDIENHRLTSIDRLATIYGITHNKKELNKLIEIEKKKSIQYLEKYL